MRRFASAATVLVIVSSGGGVAVGAAPKPPSGAALQALAKPPSYSAFASQRLYFVMPDRYANGDPANDEGGKSGGRSATGLDRADTGWYHGGDLKGLTGTCTDTQTGLARLKDLGFTGIWVTPAVVQQAVQGDSAAYHGYWGLDFTRVDPHLGTNDDFAAFADCAHRLGLKVYLDVVVNHTADVILLSGGTSFRSPAEMPYRNCRGRPYKAQVYAGGKAFPCLSNRYQPRQPVVLQANRSLKKPAWLNDVVRYHNRGDIDFSSCSDVCFEQGDFFGLDDVFTEQPFVVSGLAQVYGDWVRRYKLDGFRVDTAKHVDRAFFRSWAPKIRAAGRGGRRQGVRDLRRGDDLGRSRPGGLHEGAIDPERPRLPAPGHARPLRGWFLRLEGNPEPPRRRRLLPRTDRGRTNTAYVPRQPRHGSGCAQDSRADGRHR